MASHPNLSQSTTSPAAHNAARPASVTVVQTPKGPGTLQGVADNYLPGGIFDGTYASVLVNGTRYTFPLSQIGMV